MMTANTAIPVYTPEQLHLLKYTSYSFNETLYCCPRRFELDKLLGRGQETHATFEFGRAVGAGTQKLMVTGSVESAIWECFLNWNMDLDDESEESAKKTFWHACAAVESFQLVMKNELAQWKVMHFNGKPASELSFKIDLGDGFGYFGHVDLGMQHTVTGGLAVFEGKTTKFNKVDEASYKNSNQGVGYSLVLDSLAQILGIPEGPQYSVYYPVYKTSSMAWEVFPFAKSYTQRADFIQNMLFDKQTVQMYLAAGKFPKRGSGCYNFFRQCQHFDLCDMSNEYLIGKRVVDSQILYGDPNEKYDFEFKLDDLIDAQIRRVQS